MVISEDDLYNLHNNLFELACMKLVVMNRQDLADRFQALAQEKDGAFLIHTLIQTVLDSFVLDTLTEP